MRRQYVDAPRVLRPEDFLVLQDSRERAPWDLRPLRVEVATLATADYSIRGLEDLVAVERKTLLDLVACCGSARERFERELDRLRAYPHRCVVVEASWAEIGAGGWPGVVSPAAVMSSIASWTAEGIPFVMAGDRQGAADYAKRFLMAVARHAHGRLRAFADQLAPTAATPERKEVVVW